MKRFEGALPELWGGQLLPYAAALQENTLGCIGTLSLVLTRAALLAQGSGGWSEDFLWRALLTKAQHQQILNEVLEGEAAINPGVTRTVPASWVRSQKTRKIA